MDCGALIQKNTTQQAMNNEGILHILTGETFQEELLHEQRCNRVKILYDPFCVKYKKGK